MVDSSDVSIPFVQTQNFVYQITLLNTYQMQKFVKHFCSSHLMSNKDPGHSSIIWLHQFLYKILGQMIRV